MKIGSEPIEIKPINPEGFSGGVSWKTDVSIIEVENMIEGLSSESRPESIIGLEKVCNKIIQAKDIGLYSVSMTEFGIDSLQCGLDRLRENMSEIFDKIKSGENDGVEKIKDFIFNYKLYYLGQYEKALSYKDEAKKDFVTMIEQMSSRYNINIDFDKVRSIVEKTPIKFLDGTYFGDKFNLTTAKHVAKGEVYIGLDSFFSEEGFRYIYFHELLHAISIDYSKIIHMGPWNDPAGVQSTGVDFSGNFEDKNRGFIWLNEAFTDVVAAMMANNNEKDTPEVYPRYKAEIKLINLLSEKGQINILTKISGVYFRHIVKNNNEQNSTNQWKAFSKEIDGIFGPRFLVRLDIFIEKNGINKAIEVIEKWEAGKINLDDLV